MVGPTVYLMRADSATVARVWLRKITVRISDADAASVAIGANRPVPARRLRIVRTRARAPMSSGASAISPCGAVVAVKAATMIATAAGARRRVAMEYSRSTQVAITPKAISGSGRRPLLNGYQAARKTAAAVQMAMAFEDTPRAPGPSRGSTQRDSNVQVAMPASSAGSRIHTPAVLTVARCASTDWYQSNGASEVPK